MTNKQPIWHKTAAATLALTMIVGGATGAMASAKSNKQDSKHSSSQNKKNNGKKSINLDFGDLKQNDWKWAYDHIIRLAAQGVFNGYDDGSFKPSNNISRIEAIVAAVRLLGLQTEAEKPENMNATLNFKDFDQLKKKYSWAVGYVAVALQNDLFSETDTTIQADKPANRIWASILLVKSMKLDAEAKLKMDAVLPFSDAKDIPAGAVGYVEEALEKNLITGYNNNTFQPNRPVTRAELAALLDRVDQQLPGSNTTSQAINGTIQSVGTGTVTVKKADNTTVNVTVDPNVFIFRNNVKSPLSALVAGDVVLIRTYEGNAIFIEVTSTSTPPVVTTLVDSGTVSSFTLNAQGKISSLTLTKVVNGVTQVIIYNVDANVTITGNSGVLSPNLNVVVNGENGVVKSIVIQP
jgi:hypothetical protein